jgi:nanoRNase/pAp phosphatase (c-di-AMP/oligoRNAs hydrolase)
MTTNLRYREEVHLCFDHHLSETLRSSTIKSNHIIDATAPSAARVVWKYYGGHDVFPRAWDEMLDAVDKADSAQFKMHEIIESYGWVLLNFLIDARTGLERFHNFRISNYHLMMDLIEHCRSMCIDEILALPDVQELVELYGAQDELYRLGVKRCSTVHGALVMLDLRNEEEIYLSNRFMIYTMHSACTVSMHVLNGFKNQNTVFVIGKSILN